MIGRKDPQKLCLVSFPCDLGSLAVESNLKWLLSRYVSLQVFRFGVSQSDFASATQIGSRRLVKLRDCLPLNLHLHWCRQQNIPVVFHQIAPALHALPYLLTAGGDGIYDFIDWTRTLPAKVQGIPHRNGLCEKSIVELQKLALSKMGVILTATDAVSENLKSMYAVSDSRLRRVTMPINIEHFQPDPGRRSFNEDSKPKVLFVGGDIVRKGGDLLVKWWSDLGWQLCDLTVASNTPPPGQLPPNLSWVTGAQFGSPEHLRMYQEHDILCLPSHFDPWGMVLGEAASCGLAVVTTNQALGWEDTVVHNVNGLVAADAASCVESLHQLVTTTSRIHDMKAASRRHMVERFAPELVFSQFAGAMNINR